MDRRHPMVRTGGPATTKDRGEAARATARTAISHGVGAAGRLGSSSGGLSVMMMHVATGSADEKAARGSGRSE